jgi:hypothetical protein
MEYLISQNNFRSILNLIHLLNDKIMISDSMIIIPIDEHVIDTKDMHMLLKETKVFVGGKDERYFYKTDLIPK